MWLKPVLKFVDQDHGRLASRLALKTGQQQAGRTNPQGAQRNAVRAVKRDGPATERYRVGIQHRLQALANWNPKLRRGSLDNPQRLAELGLCQVAECGSRLP